jgi:hypothetical protein
MNIGDQADAWKECAMQSQPTSLILLAEVRHAELQAEVAIERLARRAFPNSSLATSIMAGVGRRLGIMLTGVATLLHHKSTLAITFGSYGK